MEAVTSSPYFILTVVALVVVSVWLLLRSKTSRIIKYDVNTLTTVFFMLAILILINAIPASMHELALGNLKIPLEGKKDFTQNQRITLSPDTIKDLQALKEDVHATAFYYHNHPEEKAAQDLFAQYRFYTSHFSFEFVDPVTDLLKTQQYQDQLRFIDPSHATIVPGTIVLEVPQPEGATPRRVSIQLPLQGKPGDAEQKLTDGILQLEKKDKQIVYFTTGHGERDPNDPKSKMDKVKDIMEKSMYTLKDLSLYKEGKVPGDAAVVVICGPQKDFEKQEIDALRDWVKKGGRVMFMIDPPAQYPNLQAFLDEYGCELGNDIILDPSRGFQHNPLFPEVADFSPSNPITSGYNVEVFLQLARSVAGATKMPPGVTLDVICKTEKEAWALKGVDKGIPGGSISYDPKRDQPGPIGVAAAITVKATASPSPSPSSSASPAASPSPSPTPDGRMVVYGCSSYIAGGMFMLVGNGDLFMRSVNWLAQTNDSGSIETHAPFVSPPLTLNDAQKWRVWWISMFLIPGMIAMIGLLVFMMFKPN